MRVVCSPPSSYSRGAMDVLMTLTLTISIMLVLAFSATCETVEPPRRVRNSRSSHHGGIKISVSPSNLNMRYGDVIKIKCRARGGFQVEDMPFTNFYRKLGPHTVLPMSSGFPGVTIESVAPGRHMTRHKRSVKYLRLGPEVWQTLYPGENVFYCKGYTMKNHDKDAAYFSIFKV